MSNNQELSRIFDHLPSLPADSRSSFGKIDLKVLHSTLSPVDEQ